MACVASIVFFIKFVSIDLEESLYAIFQIGASIVAVYIAIVAYFLQHKINGIFKGLTAIYGKCKYFKVYLRQITIYLIYIGTNYNLLILPTNKS